VAVLACIHHLEWPSLGLAAGPFARADVEVVQYDLRRGDPLPDPDAIDGLLCLGGEQSLREIESYPYLLDEVELLGELVGRRVPILGICLGGQLLAHSQGARIDALPQRSISWPTVRKLPAAAADPLWAGMPDREPALHWNEDFFEVPSGALELLSRSDLGGEAIRVGECAWGLQFHPEADSGILERWYERDGPLQQAGVSAAQARAADRRWMPTQRRLSETLFGAFARLVASVDGG
jgi:GMP synthase-like glutamine amidotransferase